MKETTKTNSNNTTINVYFTALAALSESDIVDLRGIIYDYYNMAAIWICDDCNVDRETARSYAKAFLNARTSDELVNVCYEVITLYLKNRMEAANLLDKFNDVLTSISKSKTMDEASAIWDKNPDIKDIFIDTVGKLLGLYSPCELLFERIDFDFKNWIRDSFEQAKKNFYRKESVESDDVFKDQENTNGSPSETTKTNSNNVAISVYFTAIAALPEDDKSRVRSYAISARVLPAVLYNICHVDREVAKSFKNAVYNAQTSDEIVSVYCKAIPLYLKNRMEAANLLDKFNNILAKISESKTINEASAIWDDNLDVKDIFVTTIGMLLGKFIAFANHEHDFFNPKAWIKESFEQAKNNLCTDESVESDDVPKKQENINGSPSEAMKTNNNNATISVYFTAIAALPEDDKSRVYGCAALSSNIPSMFYSVCHVDREVAISFMDAVYNAQNSDEIVSVYCKAIPLYLKSRMEAANLLDKFNNILAKISKSKTMDEVSAIWDDNLDVKDIFVVTIGGLFGRFISYANYKNDLFNPKAWIKESFEQAKKNLCADESVESDNNKRENTKVAELGKYFKLIERNHPSVNDFLANTLLNLVTSGILWDKYKTEGVIIEKGLEFTEIPIDTYASQSDPTGYDIALRCHVKTSSGDQLIVYVNTNQSQDIGFDIKCFFPRAIEGQDAVQNQDAAKPVEIISPLENILTTASGIVASTHWAFDFLFQSYYCEDRIEEILKRSDEASHGKYFHDAIPVAATRGMKTREENAGTIYELIEAYNMALDSALNYWKNRDELIDVAVEFVIFRDMESLLNKYGYKVNQLETGIISVLGGIIADHGKNSRLKNEFGIDPAVWLTECFHLAAQYGARRKTGFFK